VGIGRGFEGWKAWVCPPLRGRGCAYACARGRALQDTLTAIHRAFDIVQGYRGERLILATLPAEDPETYAMIGKADTIGVFQIESRAQMGLLPRLRPRCYYDLVIEVAIIRPGPIQGEMVHPYLRAGRGSSPSPIPRKRSTSCSAGPWACRCSRSRSSSSPWW
jgi:hypothetical protein